MTEEKKEKEETKEEEVSEKEIEEIKLVQRCINIHTLNTQVEISSQDPEDNIDKLKKIAEHLVDKYTI